LSSIVCLAAIANILEAKYNVAVTAIFFFRVGNKPLREKRQSFLGRFSLKQKPFSLKNKNRKLSSASHFGSRAKQTELLLNH